MFTNEKTKKIIIGIVGGVAVIIIGIVIFFTVLWPVEQKTTVLYVELGTQPSTNPADYLTGYDWSVEYGKVDVANVNAMQVGTYEAVCTHGKNTTFTYQIVVQDTIAPTITTRTDTIYLATDREYTVDTLIESVADISGEVQLVACGETGNLETITYSETGYYTLIVQAQDPSGNQTTVEVGFTVDTAPVITGTRNCYVTVDNSQDLLTGVVANDDVDGNLTASIVLDETAINWSVEGDYTAVFTVVDQYGLETQATVTVSVLSQDALNEKLATREISRYEDIIAGATNFYTAGAAEMESIKAQQTYMRNCVVHIAGEGSNYKWYGSGFVIDIRDGYVYLCSNQHVLKHLNSKAKVYFYDGTYAPVEYVGKNSKGVDAAIARVKISDISKSTMSQLRSVHISTTRWETVKQNRVSLYTIIANTNSVKAIRNGTSDRIDKCDHYSYKVFIIDVKTVSGDSGSAVLDEYGNLCGMVKGSCRDEDGIWENIAITVEDIIYTYESLTGNTLYKN